MPAAGFDERSYLPALFLACGTALALGCGAADPAPRPDGGGVLVELVGPGTAGERAGIAAGDRLTGWSRAAAPPANPEPASGILASEFALLDLTLEQKPRGELTLHGVRDGGARSWTLPAGDLGVAARPVLPPALAEEYRRLGESAREDDGAAATAALATLAEGSAAEDPALAAWFHFRAAGYHTAYRRPAAAVDSYRAAAAAGDRPAEARLHHILADFLSRGLGDPEEAGREAAAAAELWDGAGYPLAVAAARHVAAVVAQRRGDLPAAEAELHRALELKRRFSPGSLYLARTLSVMGKVKARRGDLERAEELMRQAAEIRERLDPGGIDLAHSWSALGTIRLMRGDRAGGEIGLRRALERFEAEEPRSRNVAVILGNLGVVAVERGDLVAAEDLYRRALALEEAMTPDGLGVSAHLHNLARLARRRGDLEAAEELGGKALDIRRRLAPGSLDVAYSLTNLAGVACDRGEWEASLARLRQALEIRTALAPESLEVAFTEADLGSVELERGELAEAERHLRRAEDLYRCLAPARYQLGRVLQRRGDVAEARGDPAAAEPLYRSAAQHLARSVPGTEVEADALWGLARVLGATGRREEALDAYRRAEEALEHQLGRLGGSQEVRSGFRARYRDLYRQHLELELELGRPRRAFEVLERSRARELLAMLHQRDLVFAADLPEALDADRRRAMAAVDRAQEELLEAPPDAGPDEVEERLRGLARARRELQRVADRVRAASPRLAALTEPVPATAATAAASLDQGTVALAYSVGGERSELFVLGPGAGLRVARVAAGEDELRRRVERLRHLLRLGPARRPAAGRASREALSEEARELYRLLVEPAAEEVAGARRLLIVPDGPLHLLPFAALETGDPAPARRYLGSAVPLHAAASLSVWSEIRRRRGERGGLSLAAFADPEPPFAPGGSSAAGGTVLRGSAGTAAPAPLPASRGEATVVARRFADARVYLGDRATEGRARAASAAESHLHFAVHGFLDQRFPLSSGLILARDPEGGEGNGLLQAWEIFEGVRTDAHLVTLSACETALGAEVAGEGLLGLTRAFQYAGARAVLASLWRVSDRSTAALMDRLYLHLRQGLPPAEALRAARAEMVAGPVSPPSSPAGWWGRLGLHLGLVPPEPAEDFSHPWHWAGFRLDGDWR